eukprot:1079167-Prorocentrum_minimum.AAC.2
MNVAGISERDLSRRFPLNLSLLDNALDALQASKGRVPEESSPTPLGVHGRTAKQAEAALAREAEQAARALAEAKRQKMKAAASAAEAAAAMTAAATKLPKLPGGVVIPPMPSGWKVTTPRA